MQKIQKIFWFLVIAALLIFGLSYFLRGKQSASIQVLYPAGGETLITGSTQTIKWSNKNIPTSNKISITIRRIPMSPLQEEVQEFDPIIFTDLPNTGSKDWTISDMYPNGNYVIGITSYTSIPITDSVLAESNQFTISKPQLIGNDRDTHGCIGSAGYSWCEAKKLCIRSWEQYCTYAMSKTVVFMCDNSKSITATFYIKDDKFVDLKLSDDRNISVPHAISASGARYTNQNESFVFWNKGDTAFITEGASSTLTFSNCTLQ
jgi:membrane-bound inhibitor of C-type lysozyme